MAGSKTKFRLGNLVVNLGTGGLEKPCYVLSPWCRKFKSELPCVIPSYWCGLSPCGGGFSCGHLSPCGPNSPCGGLKSLHCLGGSCAAGSRIEDWFKDTPVIIEEIDDLEVIAELKNDLQVALKAIQNQEEALTSAYQPQTLEEAEELELELKSALTKVEEMKGKLRSKK